MNNKEYKYIVVYEHYKNLIEKGVLQAGAKLPSLIVCSRELSVSKTTVEAAYFQLASDGYVISKEKSGYYVTNRNIIKNKKSSSRKNSITRINDNIKYDLSKIGDDPSIFRFDLWQRYLKSAVRREERLATYGEPEGEIELKEAICDYVRKNRTIYCNPDNIIIGASTQTLLMLLLPLLKNAGAKTASVPATGFERYASIFESHELSVGIRNKESDIIYVSPSHMTPWGDIMPLNRRYEILEHSKKGHLIIEDDYLNELVFTKQPLPSIYALSGGENIVYMGSFSRILLPSIRISYMILPDALIEKYRRYYKYYDQTASKIEQLALGSFIRDEHIYRQIKRLKKTYSAKKSLLKKILYRLADDQNLEVIIGDCGTEMLVRGSIADIKTFEEKLEKYGVRGRLVKKDDKEQNEEMIFSCSVIGNNELIELINALN